jgi:hypothetical protein
MWIAHRLYRVCNSLLEPSFLLTYRPQAFNPPQASVQGDSGGLLKFGILGAAQIAPLALISSSKSHPEVQIYAVAARDEKRALEYGKKYGIPKVYGGKNAYQGVY